MSDFMIPSSTGKWYDYKGDEVTDFSSDEPTTLYADPSKDTEGSKLVNLRDLKAALEGHGGSGLPLAFGDVLYQGTEEDPGCVMAMSRNDQVGIVISGSNDFSPGQDPAISIIERTGLYIDAINDATRHSVQVGVVRGTPGIFVDGALLDPATGPYGFARYATDQDFEDYVFAAE